MANDCLFCKIASGQVPSSQVYNDSSFYAFRDINPAAPAHILIIPRKHIERISDAAPDDAELIGNLFVTANRVAEQEGLTDFRYVINCGPQAGQSVFHVHLHLLAGREFYWPPG
jgi:histidine triad (HIT) family protein